MNQSIGLYLQMVRRGNYDYRRQNDLRLVSATIDPPETREPGSVVVKVLLRLPSEAFEPSKDPAVTVEFPADMIAPPPMVEITAQDPS